MDKAAVMKSLQHIQELIRKCGGPGGTPGPCAGGGNGKKPPASSGKKPPKPAAGKPKPGKKPPPKKPGKVPPGTPHLAPLNMGKPKKPGKNQVKPLTAPKGKSAWQKAMNVGYLAFQKSSRRVGELATAIKQKIDAEFKISGMTSEVRGKISGFADKIISAGKSVNQLVAKSKARVHKILDSMTEKLQKAAKDKDALDPEEQLTEEMKALAGYVKVMKSIEESLMLVTGLLKANPKDEK